MNRSIIIACIIITAMVILGVYMYTSKPSRSVLKSVTDTPSFDNVVFFGDSLSDTGNLYAKNFGIMPKDPPYYKGRFSNGKVWAEKVAAVLYPNESEREKRVVNYAVGGEVIALHVGKYLPWNLRGSVLSYFYDYIKKQRTRTQSPKTLFIIWLGGNDYLNGASNPDSYTTSVVDTFMGNVKTLINYGAKQFLIINLPDLSKTPFSVENGTQANVQQLSALHNQKLNAAINSISAAHYGLNIKLYDITETFNKIETDLPFINKTYGINIKNITQPCWQGGYTSATNQTGDPISIESCAKFNGNSSTIKFDEGVITPLPISIVFEPSYKYSATIGPYSFTVNYNSYPVKVDNPYSNLFTVSFPLGDTGDYEFNCGESRYTAQNMYTTKLDFLVDDPRGRYLKGDIYYIYAVTCCNNEVGSLAYLVRNEVVKNALMRSIQASEPVEYKDVPSLSTSYMTAKLYEAHALKVCDNPDSYLYWDKVHPSAEVHKVIGTVIGEYIQNTFRL